MNIIQLCCAHYKWLSTLAAQWMSIHFWILPTHQWIKVVSKQTKYALSKCWYNTPSYLQQTHIRWIRNAPINYFKMVYQSQQNSSKSRNYCLTGQFSELCWITQTKETFGNCQTRIFHTPGVLLTHKPTTSKQRSYTQWNMMQAI